MTNKNVALIRALINDVRERKRTGLFVAEGKKAIAQIMRSRTPEFIVCRDDFFRTKKNQDGLFQSSCECFFVPEKLFNTLSSLETAEGIIACFRQFTDEVKDVLSYKQGKFVLCDRLQDPANMGVIVRLAACFGVNALFLTPGSIDVYNPKVIRASAGFLSQIAVMQLTIDDVRSFAQHTHTLYASVVLPGKAQPLTLLRDVPECFMLAFGNEARGISEALKDAANTLFYIPIVPGCDSLNVASAVAISLYHFCGRTCKT